MKGKEQYTMHSYTADELREVVHGVVKKRNDTASIFKKNSKGETWIIFKLTTLTLPTLVPTNREEAADIELLLDPTLGYDMPEIAELMNLGLAGCRIGLCGYEKNSTERTQITFLPLDECTHVFVTSRYMAAGTDDFSGRPEMPGAICSLEDWEQKPGGAYEVSCFQVFPIGYRCDEGGQSEENRLIMAEFYRNLAKLKFGIEEKEGSDAKRGGVITYHYEDDMQVIVSFAINADGQLMKPDAVVKKKHNYENVQVSLLETWEKIPDDWMVVGYTQICFSDPAIYEVIKWPTKITMAISDRLEILEYQLKKKRKEKMDEAGREPVRQFEAPVKTWSKKVEERAQGFVGLAKLTEEARERARLNGQNPN